LGRKVLKKKTVLINSEFRNRKLMSRGFGHLISRLFEKGTQGLSKTTERAFTWYGPLP
jgi:hypothetical protein